MISNSVFAEFELSSRIRATKVQTWHVWHTQTTHERKKGLKEIDGNLKKGQKCSKAFYTYFPGQKALFEKTVCCIILFKMKMKRNFWLLTLSSFFSSEIYCV